MWKLKSCPKCGGDIFIDKDFNGWYEECLQCGFSRELVEMVSAEKHAASGNKAKGESGAHPVST